MRARLGLVRPVRRHPPGMGSGLSVPSERVVLLDGLLHTSGNPNYRLRLWHDEPVEIITKETA